VVLPPPEWREYNHSGVETQPLRPALGPPPLVHARSPHRRSSRHASKGIGRCYLPGAQQTLNRRKGATPRFGTETARPWSSRENAKRSAETAPEKGRLEEGATGICHGICGTKRTADCSHGCNRLLILNEALTPLVASIDSCGSVPVAIDSSYGKKVRFLSPLGGARSSGARDEWAGFRVGRTAGPRPGGRRSQ